MEKILVVDDEQDVQTILCEMLSVSGYTCARASDGVEGWEAFLAEKPGLALIDLEMPRMNGMQLSRKILAHNPKFPIIIVTAFAHKYESEIETLGIRGVIEKPVDFAKLRKLIGENL